MQQTKIKFEYWKYCIVGDKIKKQIVSAPVVSPYAIIYDEQQFYMIGIKEGKQEFFHYRLDRIKNLVQLSDKITSKKTEKEVEQYAETSVSVFSGNEVDIEAECMVQILEDVVEKFGKKAKIEPINNQKFKLHLSANPIGFQLWAMKNLHIVIVTKPESLVKEIQATLQNASKRYGI